MLPGRAVPMRLRNSLEGRGGRGTAQHSTAPIRQLLTDCHTEAYCAASSRQAVAVEL